MLLLLWCCLLACLALIVQFGLLSRLPLSWLLAGLSRADLVLHVWAFAGLAVPPFLLFGVRTRVVLTLLGVGALLEILQLTIPLREASLSDLLADGVGIASAAVLVIAVRRRLMLSRSTPDRDSLGVMNS